MIDLIKGVFAVGVAVVAYFAADEVTKRRTGKHIHQHAADWFQAFRQRWQEWLKDNPDVRVLFFDPDDLRNTVAGLRETVASAYKRGRKEVKAKLFGLDERNECRVIGDAEVSLDQLREMLGEEQVFEGRPMVVVACA